MRHQGILASLLLVPLLAGGALAAEADRYKLEKSGSGWVRMDTQTGEMSICEERAGQLVCKLAADERAAFQEDVDRLLSSIKGLEDRVTALENSLTAKLERTLPTEEEFEKTMSYMERFFRGFIGIVKELEQEAPGEDPAEPKAQKT
jgi:flagellar motility protein MotE (MotC chaperone)